MESQGYLIYILKAPLWLLSGEQVEGAGGRRGRAGRKHCALQTVCDGDTESIPDGVSR